MGSARHLILALLGHICAYFHSHAHTLAITSLDYCAFPFLHCILTACPRSISGFRFQFSSFLLYGLRLLGHHLQCQEAAQRILRSIVHIIAAFGQEQEEGQSSRYGYRCLGVSEALPALIPAHRSGLLSTRSIYYYRHLLLLQCVLSTQCCKQQYSTIGLKK